ncbi:MAG: UDP-2,3-diacylglucosamine diphosphatase [Proteobacteria bacterium]|nr:UDP-2,3-diacylglucosamine diphosphatase [Pseudomonadota bacterium]
MTAINKHYRAIFISDVHLGTRGCQAQRLASFLKHHTCDELYLVGDIIDGWRLKYNFYWPQEHSNVMRRFLTKARRGTKVTYITGNHDEFLRRYSDCEFGQIRIVDQVSHIAADGKRLLVVHGDRFDIITRYHRWLAFLGDIGYSFLLRANHWVHLLRRQFGYEYWSLSGWLKYRVKRAVNYISEYEAGLSRHCSKAGYDGVICGHIHHAEITSMNDVVYMNCGDWVESCTALVEDHEGQFSIVHWSEADVARCNGQVVSIPRRYAA